LHKCAKKLRLMRTYAKSPMLRIGPWSVGDPEGSKLIALFCAHFLLFASFPIV
jgi:hypothetical protein